MAAFNQYTDTNIDQVNLSMWNSGDTLTINNGAVITCNTNQTKFWSGITINNGKLRIVNDSTTTPIRFLLGRASGTTAPSITPASGLGSIEIQGNWIEIGTGTGVAGQTLTLPYQDHVPAIWVETEAGSGVYDIWCNVLQQVVPGTPHRQVELASVGSGSKGNYFKQLPAANPTEHLVFTNCTLQSTTVVTNIDTTKIKVGAKIVGTGIPANTVVQSIINSTALIMNASAVMYSTTATVTIYNTFDSQLTNQAVVGDGVHGNVIPVGAKIRVPNIMVTAVFAASLAGSSDQLANITLTNGGSLTADKCLFPMWQNPTLNQAQRIRLTNVGITGAISITRCGDLYLDNIGFAEKPQYALLTNNHWRDGVGYYGVSVLNLQYCPDAVATNIRMFTHSMYSAGTRPATGWGPFLVQYCERLVADRIRVMVSLGVESTGMVGLQLVFSNNCVITNYEVYGAEPVRFDYSSNNKIEDVTYGTYGFNTHILPGWTYPGFNVVTKDPSTKLEFEIGKTYYWKSLLWMTATDQEAYQTREVAFMLYDGEPGAPDWVEIVPTTTGASAGFVRRNPIVASPAAYQLFRSEVPGCPVRDATTLVNSTTNTAATTLADTTGVPGTKYWYVLRKYTEATVYHDIGAWEITVLTQADIYPKNLALQSVDPSSALSWPKSSVTFTSVAEAVCPVGVKPGLRVANARRIYSTSASNNISQIVAGLIGGTTYTYSHWLRFGGYAADGAELQPTLQVRQRGDTVYNDITLTSEWTRYSVTFTPAASGSVIIGLILPTTNRYVEFGDATLVVGSTPDVTIQTTTAAGNPSFPVGGVRAFCRNVPNSVLQRQIAWYVGTWTFPTRTSNLESHISDVPNFTPSETTLVCRPRSGAPGIQFSSSSTRNTISRLTQIGAGRFPLLHWLSFDSSSSFNLIEDVDVDFMGGTRADSPQRTIYVGPDCNNNVMRYWKLRGIFPSSLQSVMLTADNTTFGTVLQNIKLLDGAADFSLDMLGNNMTVRGVSGGYGLVPANSTTWTLGQTGSVPVTFNGVYDTHCSETYHTETLGAINLYFQSSTLDNPPYTLTGTAALSNTGSLFLQSAGDSYTFTWPHKIYGISYIDWSVVKTLTTDMGPYTDILPPLLLEYQTDVGSGFSEWIKRTDANSPSYYDAINGFNLKIRLTARPFIRHSTLANPYQVGEVIRAAAGGGTATVEEVYAIGAAGVVALSNVTGTWTSGTSVVRNSDGQTRSNTINTNGVVVGPSFTSLIKGLQVSTWVDRTIDYPRPKTRLSITGFVAGSDVVVYEAGTDTVLVTGNEVSSPWVYEYTGTPMVDIGLFKAGYKPERYRNLQMTAIDSSFPVSQRVDLSYM